jgi:hypothetical protein
MTNPKGRKTNIMTMTSQSSRGLRRAGVATGAAAICASLVLGLSPMAGAASAPGGGGIGASGNVASITGSTMEVQSTSAQTAVSWTPTTTFSETATKTISAVAVGDCLMVVGSPAKKSKTTIAARTITISTPSASGACVSGFGGGAGGGFGGHGRFGAGGTGGAGGSGSESGTGTTPARGSFPGGGSGRPGGGRGSFPGAANLAIATGKVTGVSGSSVSLSGTLLSQLFRSSSSSKSAKKPTAPKTQKLKVTTSTSTTLSETQSTTATAVAVGDCVTAFGPASSTGAVTATTVRITSTGGQSCSTGFGGFGGGRFGGPGGGGSGGQTGA